MPFQERLLATCKEEDDKVWFPVASPPLITEGNQKVSRKRKTNKQINKQTKNIRKTIETLLNRKLRL